MKVIFHFPETVEGMELLQDRITTAHANIITNYIQKLDCSPEQKGALLDSIIDELQRGEVS